MPNTFGVDSQTCGRMYSPSCFNKIGKMSPDSVSPLAVPKVTFKGFKRINKGPQAGIPLGCVYSKPSYSAVFNAHVGPPGVPHNDNYKLVCTNT